MGEAPREGTSGPRGEDIIMPVGLKGMLILPTPAGHALCKTENFKDDGDEDGSGRWYRVQSPLEGPA